MYVEQKETILKNEIKYYLKYECVVLFHLLHSRAIWQLALSFALRSVRWAHIVTPNLAGGVGIIKVHNHVCVC